MKIAAIHQPQYLPYLGFFHKLFHCDVFVPLGDVQALADAIIELLTDQEKARRMGEQGRRIALERFDERLVFEKVKAEYARLLQEKGFSVPTPREE